jgi:hypothetical protein
MSFINPAHPNHRQSATHQLLGILMAIIIISGCQSSPKEQSLLHVQTQKDLIKARKEINHLIFKKSLFPTSRFPDLVENDISDPQFKNLEDLLQIDRLTINMKHGVNSVVYIFSSKKKGPDLVIFHGAHHLGFEDEKPIISSFLKNGITVIALSMPLTGMNNKPKVFLPSFGLMQLNSHNQFAFLETDEFSPLSYFIEPVAAALNHALKFNDYKSVAMVGISGGGFVTDLYSALDERVQKSYPVAGSVPIVLRNGVGNEWGDYEQTHVQLLRITNYVDLYIMGSAGPGRKRIQILNKYDPCCFGGDRSNQYKGIVQDTVEKMGHGNFDIFLDDTHKEHKLSDRALRLILTDILGNQ